MLDISSRYDVVGNLSQWEIDKFFISLASGDLITFKATFCKLKDNNIPFEIIKTWKHTNVNNQNGRIWVKQHNYTKNEIDIL